MAGVPASRWRREGGGLWSPAAVGSGERVTAGPRKDPSETDHPAKRPGALLRGRGRRRGLTGEHHPDPSQQQCPRHTAGGAPPPALQRREQSALRDVGPHVGGTLCPAIPGPSPLFQQDLQRGAEGPASESSVQAPEAARRGWGHREDFPEEAQQEKRAGSKGQRWPGCSGVRCTVQDRTTPRPEGRSLETTLTDQASRPLRPRGQMEPKAWREQSGLCILRGYRKEAAV